MQVRKLIMLMASSHRSSDLKAHPKDFDREKSKVGFQGRKSSLLCTPQNDTKLYDAQPPISSFASKETTTEYTRETWPLQRCRKCSPR